MGFGGPVWHASAAQVYLSEPNDAEKLRAAALSELLGIGDASLGEWYEWTGRAYHVRRRLTLAEERRVGPLVDVRGSTEAVARLRAVVGFYPAQMHAGFLSEADACEVAS